MPGPLFGLPRLRDLFDAPDPPAAFDSTFQEAVAPPKIRINRATGPSASPFAPADDADDNTSVETVVTTNGLPPLPDGLDSLQDVEPPDFG
jgi:hypothetical protein